MARIKSVILLLGALLTLAAASCKPQAPRPPQPTTQSANRPAQPAPQTFCKCTCFKNSTIIPLSQDPSAKASLFRRSPNFLSFSDTPPDYDVPSNFHDTPDIPHAKPQRPTAISPTKRSLKEKRVPSACSACTKTFCRDHNLPICHGAEDDDITTMCFQRDSSKDRVIVWCFILGTLGLLGWAAFRGVRAAREARARARGGAGDAEGRGWFGAFSRGGGGGYAPIGQG